MSAGFFLWWRRVKHWSIALLAATSALDVVAQSISFLAINIPRFTKTPLEDFLPLFKVSAVLHLIAGVLLLVAGIGLISAARDHFRSEERMT